MKNSLRIIYRPEFLWKKETQVWEQDKNNTFLNFFFILILEKTFTWPQSALQSCLSFLLMPSSLSESSLAAFISQLLVCCNLASAPLLLLKQISPLRSPLSLPDRFLSRRQHVFEILDISLPFKTSDICAFYFLIPSPS